MLKSLVIVASIACFVLTITLAGCTRHPNEEQLNTLEETQKAALAAEEELAQKQQEKADLENELAEKKQKIQDAKSEKEAIQNKLGGN
jgi:septal ring factor EnvC (AmiA/AmiB activator)